MYIVNNRDVTANKMLFWISTVFCSIRLSYIFDRKSKISPRLSETLLQYHMYMWGDHSLHLQSYKKVKYIVLQYICQLRV
jgi:hypothetical protein